MPVYYLTVKMNDAHLSINCPDTTILLYSYSTKWWPFSWILLSSLYDLKKVYTQQKCSSYQKKLSIWYDNESRLDCLESSSPFIQGTRQMLTIMWKCCWYHSDVCSIDQYQYHHVDPVIICNICSMITKDLLCGIATTLCKLDSLQIINS